MTKQELQADSSIHEDQLRKIQRELSEGWSPEIEHDLTTPAIRKA